MNREILKTTAALRKALCCLTCTHRGEYSEFGWVECRLYDCNVSTSDICRDYHIKEKVNEDDKG